MKSALAAIEVYDDSDVVQKRGYVERKSRTAVLSEANSENPGGHSE
jgi:hypothetical protein